ncbi:MAG: M23 family metallopeptidase [Bacteroidetes bacterium]|nr:M23 family metallopeptidase [Bacteroidota bacterium]
MQSPPKSSQQPSGDFAKVDGEYKTQYLHMSKIAKGMKRGTRVRQGEVIGYVSSTGLATGPHVCCRFWKDGQQVDPLRQKLSFSDPLPAPYKKQFMSATAAVRSTLERITYAEHNIAVQKQKKLDREALQARVLQDLKQGFN